MAQKRSSFTNYSFRQLGRLSHHEIASELVMHLFFLNTGHPKGWFVLLKLLHVDVLLWLRWFRWPRFSSPALHSVPYGDLLGF